MWGLISKGQDLQPLVGLRAVGNIGQGHRFMFIRHFPVLYIFSLVVVFCLPSFVSREFPLPLLSRLSSLDQFFNRNERSPDNYFYNIDILFLTFD